MMTPKQQWILHLVQMHAPLAFANAMVKTGTVSKTSVITGLAALLARGYIGKRPEPLTIARLQGRPQRYYYILTPKGRQYLYHPKGQRRPR